MSDAVKCKFMKWVDSFPKEGRDAYYKQGLLLGSSNAHAYIFFKEGYQAAQAEATALVDELVASAEKVVQVASRARRYELGVGGQTLQACAERTVLYRMPLSPIQELEEALTKAQAWRKV